MSRTCEQVTAVVAALIRKRLFSPLRRSTSRKARLGRPSNHQGHLSLGATGYAARNLRTNRAVIRPETKGSRILSRLKEFDAAIHDSRNAIYALRKSNVADRYVARQAASSQAGKGASASSDDSQGARRRITDGRNMAQMQASFQTRQGYTVPAAGASCSGFFQGQHSCKNLCQRQHTAQSARSRSVIESRYRGKGTDLSRVPAFRRHDKDTGSSEVQIASISARIQQLTRHLQEHKKDYGSRRGLEALLSRRRHFMQYLYKHDRQKYENLITELKIRPLRIQAGRGVVVRATEEGLVVDTEARQAGSAEENV